MTNQILAVSIPLACDFTGVKKDLIYAAINNGELKSLKIGNRRLIRVESLDDWLRLKEKQTSHGSSFLDQD